MTEVEEESRMQESEYRIRDSHRGHGERREDFLPRRDTNEEDGI